MLNEDLDLAFDHLRIVRNAHDRTRPRRARGLGHRDGFRRNDVYDGRAAGGLRGDLGSQLDAANFRRSIVAEDVVIPTGRRAWARRRPSSRALPGGTLVEPGQAYPPEAGRKGGSVMRAVVYDRYGGPEVLRLADVPKPVPTDDEVLVEVRDDRQPDRLPHASSRPLFWRFMLGLRRPKRHVLGQEFAGEVEAVGVAVTDFPWATACSGCGWAPMRVRLRAEGRHRRAHAAPRT